MMNGSRCIVAIVFGCLSSFSCFGQQTTITEREAASLVRMVLRHEKISLPSRYCELESLDRRADPFIPDYYSFGASCDFPGAAATTPFGVYVVSPRTGQVWKFIECTLYRFPGLRRVQRRIMQRTHPSEAEESKHSFAHGCSSDETSAEN